MKDKVIKKMEGEIEKILKSGEIIENTLPENIDYSNLPSKSLKYIAEISSGSAKGIEFKYLLNGQKYGGVITHRPHKSQ